MLFYIEKCETMEKLIELLLECKPQVHYLDKPKGVYDKKYGIGWYKREWDIGWWFSEEVIISKKFWFIQRLVENDKIDLEKVYEKIWKPQIIMYEEWSKEEELCEIIWVNERDYYEDIIMLLSISDTPIEDLISYLK